MQQLGLYTPMTIPSFTRVTYPQHSSYRQVLLLPSCLQTCKMLYFKNTGSIYSILWYPSQISNVLGGGARPLPQGFPLFFMFSLGVLFSVNLAIDPPVFPRATNPSNIPVAVASPSLFPLRFVILAPYPTWQTPNLLCFSPLLQTIQFQVPHLIGFILKYGFGILEFIFKLHDSFISLPKVLWFSLCVS